MASFGDSNQLKRQDSGRFGNDRTGSVELQDPDLDNIRSHPRYVALLEKMESEG